MRRRRRYDSMDSDLWLGLLLLIGLALGSAIAVMIANRLFS